MLSLLGFLGFSRDVVYLVHTTSSHCRGCLINGDVPLLSGDHSYQTGLSSSPTLEKGYQQELDRWKFYKGNEQSEDELNSMWAFMVMNEVETEPGGCRAGKFTDSKLQESWKTA